MILPTFDPLIPKLCSDKSESGGKWILLSHWLRNLKMLGISQWETRIHFPPLSDLSEHSFGISGPNVARISWNFECYQFFILVGPGATVVSPMFSNTLVWFITLSMLVLILVIHKDPYYSGITQPYEPIVLKPKFFYMSMHWFMVIRDQLADL